MTIRPSVHDDQEGRIRTAGSNSVTSACGGSCYGSKRERENSTVLMASGRCGESGLMATQQDHLTQSLRRNHISREPGRGAEGARGHSRRWRTTWELTKNGEERVPGRPRAALYGIDRDETKEAGNVGSTAGRTRRERRCRGCGTLRTQR